MVHYNPLGRPAEGWPKSMVRTSRPCRRYIHHVYNCSMRTSDDTWSSMNTNESPPFIAGSTVFWRTVLYFSIFVYLCSNILFVKGGPGEAMGLAASWLQG